MMKCHRKAAQRANPTRRRTADAQHDEAKASGQPGVMILAFTIGTNGKTRDQTQGTSSAMDWQQSAFYGEIIH
jgi:hypothetical protein